MEKLNYVFYHLYCDLNGHCLELFSNTFNKIKNSGLYDNVEKIFVNAIGDNVHTIVNNEIFKDKKIEITTICAEPRGEVDTIKLLWDFCQTHSNSNVLYLHSKGVSRPGNLNVQAWTSFMEYFNIEKWETCVKALHSYDTCGVNLQYEPGACYAGNFWWANTNYVQKIPQFNIKECKVPYCFNNPRNYCEFWLLDNNFNNPTTLHNSNIDHYGTLYDESKYK
jgi:hypothetical protein